MDFGRITHPLRLARRIAPAGLRQRVRDEHSSSSARSCGIGDGLRAAVRLERLVRPLLRGVNHSSEEIHVGDPQAGDQPRTRTTDRKTTPSTQAALSSDVHNMNL